MYFVPLNPQRKLYICTAFVICFEGRIPIRLRYFGTTTKDLFRICTNDTDKNNKYICISLMTFYFVISFCEYYPHYASIAYRYWRYCILLILPIPIQLPNYKILIPIPLVFFFLDYRHIGLYLKVPMPCS